MINSKLKKDVKTNSLLVEFSEQPLPRCLQLFYGNCKDEKVLLKKGSLIQNQINIYLVEQVVDKKCQQITLHNIPSKINFVISVLYFNSSQHQSTIQVKSPTKRTLLLREGLANKFYFDFQVQNTLSQQETLIYLCELCASIINTKVQRQLNFYDQRVDGMKSKNSQQNEVQRLWKNVLFQIPGLGKEKVNAISYQFPTYSDIIYDEQEHRKLKNCQVQRGTKQAKLGKIIANRIYKSLLGEKGSESIFQQEN